MRRSPGKLFCQHPHINCIALLKRRLADLVLLQMMLSTKADGPPIRGLECQATIRRAPDMSALDRSQMTVGYAAMVFAYPGAVSGTFTTVRLTSFLALKPAR